jgi:hypothetical protein
VCPESHTEGVWIPKYPRNRYWRKQPHGGEGLRKRIRCKACRRRMFVELHTRIDRDVDPPELVAFLFEVPAHR